MRRFAHFLAIDWSGAKGARQKGIAIAQAQAAGGPPALIAPPLGGWSRLQVMELLRDSLAPDTLVGMDLGISLPFADEGAFFPGWDQSPADARTLWAMIDTICASDPHLECGAFLSHPVLSRYYRHAKDHVGDRFLMPDAPSREGRFRVAELAQRQHGVRPVSNFNLVGAAQVGKSSLTGMRLLNQLGSAVSVWPIDPVPPAGPVVVEIYTSIAARSGGVAGTKTKIRNYDDLNYALAQLGSTAVEGHGTMDDHSSDALMTAAWLRNAASNPALWSPKALNDKIAQTEGWTFGAI